MDDIIGHVLGKSGKHIAKFEFIKGCGCLSSSCVELSRQESMYIPKDAIMKCVKSRKIFQIYIFFAITTILGNVYLNRNLEFIQHIRFMSSLIFIIALCVVCLYIIHLIIINESVRSAKTFSVIRKNYCDKCIVYPTCIQACTEYCNYIRQENLYINLKVKDMTLIGKERSHDQIEERLKNYLTIL